MGEYVVDDGWRPHCCSSGRIVWVFFSENWAGRITRPHRPGPYRLTVGMRGDASVCTSITYFAHLRDARKFGLAFMALAERHGALDPVLKGLPQKDAEGTKGVCDG